MVPFDQVVVTALILIEHLLTSLELSLMHVNVPLSGCQQFDLSRNRLPEAESYSYGQFKGYLFSELSMSPQGFMDEFQGKSFEVQYDDKNQTARIVGENGDEWPTLISFWFAWYAFHPDTEIYTTASK